MTVTVEPVSAPDQLAAFEALVREYLASLPFSLEFQDVDRELSDLGLAYGPPGGRALLGCLDGSPVGAVAIRRLSAAIAELKRMYVRPEARGHGVGRALAAAALQAAAELGYHAVRLDTTADMVGAIRVYEGLGFEPIEPYRHNPLAGARFFEARLHRTTGAGQRPDPTETQDQ